jgi:hypothetical protein
MSYGEIIVGRVENAHERRKAMRDIISRIMGALRRLYSGLMKAHAARGWKRSPVGPMAAQEARIKVRDILSDVSKWTRFSDAIDSEGNECDVDDERAVKFCLAGALRRAYKGQELDDAIKHIEGVMGPLVAGVLSIRGWNDDRRRTFDEVRKVIERADV